MNKQILCFYSEGWSHNFSLSSGREEGKNTGRHQNNALNAGYCNRQSMQHTLGNLLWQGFMCPVPPITISLFTLPYPTSSFLEKWSQYLEKEIFNALLGKWLKSIKCKLHIKRNWTALKQYRIGKRNAIKDIWKEFSNC